MVSSQFEAMLKDFEPYFKCRLESGVNDSCLVKMGIGITIQLELNRYGLILIGCRVGEIQGRFRDNAIKEALKANEFYPPSTGTFGFSHKSNALYLHTVLDPYRLDADKIANTLNPFIAKAKMWADALQKGDIPVVGEEAIPQSSSFPPFGFRR